MDETRSATENAAAIRTEAGACYGAAWRSLWQAFPELLLIILVSLVLAVPASVLSLIAGEGGLIAFYSGTMVLAYAVLLLWPIDYGVSYAFLKAARGEHPDIKDIFDVFKNYANAIFAHFLTTFIVGFGMMLFIVPGIVFACKLAFVPYLIVERRLDAIDAVQTSWRMTNGHAFTIFLIALISPFISILGLFFFFVGVIPASMWIKLAFAEMYVSLSGHKDEETS